jgi:hypothetical protein
MKDSEPVRLVCRPGCGGPRWKAAVSEFGLPHGEIERGKGSSSHPTVRNAMPSMRFGSPARCWALKR